MLITKQSMIISQPKQTQPMARNHRRTVSKTSFHYILFSLVPLPTIYYNYFYWYYLLLLLLLLLVLLVSCYYTKRLLSIIIFIFIYTCFKIPPLDWGKLGPTADNIQARVMRMKRDVCMYVFFVSEFLATLPGATVQSPVVQ